jgi:cytoskeletal protein CcmA (bactofilin family)
VEALSTLWSAVSEGIAAAMKRLLAFLGLDGGDDAALHVRAFDSATTIGPGITLKGELRGTGPVTVLGQFEGDVVLDGTLHVGPDGRVDANITAQAIVIGGIVRGNLSADTRVEILPTGTLAGTVRSGSFRAADGATVKGEIWVEQPDATPRRSERA